MSENSTPEERTEDPTERRMEQLRGEGALFVSSDLAQVISIIVAFYTLSLATPRLLSDLKGILIEAFTAIADPTPLTVESGKALLIRLMQHSSYSLSLVIVATAAAGALTIGYQTNWNVRNSWLRFRFSMMNPLAGIQRVFSINGVFNTGKAIFKLCLIIPVAYFALRDLAPRVPALMHASIPTLLTFTGEAIASLFWSLMLVLGIIALVDYFWGRERWLKQHRMTKQEVKEERKNAEGDEATRRKIQMKGMQRIMQRIKQSVPTADVVVTNPTHYAVALKYDRATMGAPIVVAKGKNFLAQQIKEIARANGIPVLERKPLARALYASVEVGSTIPYELFKAVAEVLAYVFRLKGKLPSPAASNRPAGASVSPEGTQSVS